CFQSCVWLLKYNFLQRTQSYIEEIVIMQGDEQQYFEVITNPIHDPSGNIIGVAGMTRDITARKKAELQIREQLDELSRWHNVTLGRESRILELKREVNALLEEAGKPPRYGSAKEATLE
nr:PAS domain-containing protein [Anaerolineaceae bacterium]HPN54193.1 PAS domain-containing protein [Anaerolineaceae bacterium]